MKKIITCHNFIYVLAICVIFSSSCTSKMSISEKEPLSGINISELGNRNYSQMYVSISKIELLKKECILYTNEGHKIILSKLTFDTLNCFSKEQLRKKYSVYFEGGKLLDICPGGLD